MIIVRCSQGDPSWWSERCGVTTASMIRVVRDKLKSGPDKGGYKKDARDYAFRLAVERISGEPLTDEKFETYAMRLGHELEPEARALHALRIDQEIEQTGLVLSDDKRFGASADGLIGTKGGSEYKCLISPEKLRTVLLDRDVSEYMDQCQCAMWLTGRQWWHLCFYCPPLHVVNRDLVIYEAERDEAWIEAMVEDLEQFDQLVETYRIAIEESQERVEVRHEAENETV